jgi:hypothetical protein
MFHAQFLAFPPQFLLYTGKSGGNAKERCKMMFEKESRAKSTDHPNEVGRDGRINFSCRSRKAHQTLIQPSHDLQTVCSRMALSNYLQLLAVTFFSIILSNSSEVKPGKRVGCYWGPIRKGLSRASGIGRIVVTRTVRKCLCKAPKRGKKLWEQSGIGDADFVERDSAVGVPRRISRVAK